MINPRLNSIIGLIKNSIRYNNGEILETEKGKFYLSPRDPELSDKDAIKLISQYGIVPITYIGSNFLLQPYIQFNHIRSKSPSEFGKLLKKIHGNSYRGKPFVHGDFAGHNTTKLDRDLKCFDFEFTHFGDPYLDIGRIILRECDTINDVIEFFEVYSGKVPKNDVLANGLSRFCDWQHLLR